ncbi:MAG: hypothetical protein RBS07_07835 [Lentimicrobium sp.]|jgi:hypothetical protein|nr:hypothetical protein [Lentimicrobium sp.]
MSNIIRHKRSNTLGAVPSYGEFTEGEILLNTRDGKAFFKKVMPGSEEIIEVRGTRDTVRPTGQTGEEVVSETGIRAAISGVVQDLIPNYFVTDLAGFIGAYNDIRGNYPGGNIYITGTIIMTADLTLDLRGISITGLGANWRFYNGTDMNPSQVFKMIITKGSPVFSGLNFWGSNGASGLQLQNGTTRQVFVISPQVIDFTMNIIFRDCRFSDIICGTPGNPFVIDSPIGPSSTIHLRFDGCNVNSHGSDMALTGFGIQYASADSTGLISVDVRNQSPSLQSHRSLKFKINSNYGHVAVFAFNSDETAWIDSDSDLANITRTNTVLQANPAPGVFSPSDSYLLMATGAEKNIVKVSAAAFAAGSGGGGAWDGNINDSHINSSTTIVVMGSHVQYIFTGGGIGNTPIYVLPVISANPHRMFYVKNAGLRKITTGSAGNDRFVDFDNSVSAIDIEPGEWAIFSSTDSTSTNWYVYKGSIGNAGGIASVGLAMPNIFTVANSPLTADGTITVSLAQQMRGRVLASPTNNNGVPSFRELSAGDIPTLPYDNYAHFEAGITGILRPIAGVNNYQNGTNYKGLTFKAGTNVSLSQTGAADGSLMITINAAAGGGGGLTSVGLSMPNIFNVSNSPLVANGTLSVSLASQAIGRVFAAPPNNNGAPYFRLLEVKDIPNLSSIYDRYKSFYFRTKDTAFGTFSTSEIEGTENSSGIYKGIAFDAGPGISMEASSTTDGLALLTIGATGGGGGGTENTVQTVALNVNPAPISTNTWTDVLELEIEEPGKYIVMFQIGIVKQLTGSGFVAARVTSPYVQLSSTEQYSPSVSGNRVTMSGHGYIDVQIIMKSLPIKLQMWASSSGWSPVTHAMSSNSPQATQLTLIKIA